MRGYGRVAGPPARALARRVGAVMCVALVAGLLTAASAAAAPNTWTATQSLATGRVDPVVAVLPQSGKVLVAGGTDSNGDSLASTEIYDPSAGTWSAGPTMHAARSNASGVVLKNGKVLIVGGQTNGADNGQPGATPDTAEIFSPDTTPSGGSFKLLSSQLSGAGRVDAGIATLPNSNGNVIVVGGADGNGNFLSSTDIFDFADSTFAPGPDMGTGMARAQPITTSLSNGDVLVAGGDTGGSGLDTAEVFDPTAGTWKPTNNTMSAGRDAGGSAPLPGGRVLVAGGIDGSTTSTATTDIYDPTSNTFTPAASMAQPRAAFGMTPLANGDIMVAGGLDFDLNAPQPHTVLTSTEIYDPARNVWSPAGSLATGVLEFGMVSLQNGEVLEAGGADDISTPSAQASLFTPAFAPTAPTGVTATPGDGRAAVRWTAATTNGDPVTSYTVTASTGQVVTVTGATTSTTVTDLTNGTPVTFTVTATNAIGTSPASAPSAAVTPTSPTTTPPTTPTAPTPPAGSHPAPDKAATLRLSGLGSHSTLKAFLKGLRFTVTPNKAVTLKITLTKIVSARVHRTLASEQFTMAKGARKAKLVPKRGLVGHPKSVKVRVTIVATDAAGTRSTVTRTLTIKS